MVNSVITGTGSFIPRQVVSNKDFLKNSFYDELGKDFAQPNSDIIEKFCKITGIEERRYVNNDETTSTIAAIAGERAIADSAINPESLDQIIVSHNFGDVPFGSSQSQMVPSIANRVKQFLKIKNPDCIAYDIIFGCPGWVQSLIQSHAYIQAGMAGKILLIGAETLSRVIDPHDRDSMIFSDGAGACVLEASTQSSDQTGILSVASQSHSEDETYFIDYGNSYGPDSDNTAFIKMKGRKVYEYAITRVPEAMKNCLTKSRVSIDHVKKIFLHQANQKLDEGILRKFYQLYGQSSAPENIMPMSIHWLGNSSVATVPTLLDLIRKGKMPEHQLNKDDIVLFASVGAGMNINCVCYRY